MSSKAGPVPGAAQASRSRRVSCMAGPPAGIPGSTTGAFRRENDGRAATTDGEADRRDGVFRRPRDPHVRLPLVVVERPARGRASPLTGRDLAPDPGRLRPAPRGPGASDRALAVAMGGWR